MNQNDLVKSLRRKNQQTLAKEQAELQNRQAYLRTKRDELWNKRDLLREELYMAAKAGQTESEKVLSKQIDDIKEDISGLDKEYQMNSTSLEAYSKVVKNNREGAGSILGTLFMGVGTGAAIWLGKESLDKAYVSDMNGTLRNKAVLEFFNKLNPLRMFFPKR